MANRYWVGGTGTWNTTSTTNWAATSGGAGGASAPTSADAVIFDANSAAGNATITMSSAVCASITSSSTAAKVLTFSGGVTVSGGINFGTYSALNNATITLTPSGNVGVALSGAGTAATGTNNINYNSNVTYTINFNAASGSNSTTHTFNAGNCTSPTFQSNISILTIQNSTASVTYNGTSLITINLSSGSFIMNGAVTVNNVNFSGGTFNRSSFTLTCANLLSISGSGSRALTGTQPIILSGSNVTFNMSDATNFSGPAVLSLTSTSTSGTRSLTGPTTGDTASNTFSISLATGAAGTFAISGAFLDVDGSSSATKTLTNSTRKIYGSFNTFGSANTTYTAGSLVTTFAATTPGKNASFPAMTNSPNFPITFDGVGGGWTFSYGTGSTLSNVTITNGSVTFGSMTLNSISSSNTNTRTITFPVSISVTLIGTTPIDFSTPTNLTFNAGSSTISCTNNTTVTFQGGGRTFNNVDFSSDSNKVDIYGANTFNGTLSFANRSIGYGEVVFNANQTIGTWQLNHSSTASAPYARTRFRSSTLGATVTITATTRTNIIDCDFTGISISGTALNVSGTNRGGNLGYNSNISFPTAKTVYLSTGSSSPSLSWNDNFWATSSGGAAAFANYPLAQDTAIVDNNSFTGPSTLVVTSDSNGLVAFPTINCSSLTTATGFSIANAEIYGGVTFSSSVTNNFSGTVKFLNITGTKTITSAGKTWNANIQVITNAKVGISDAFTQGSAYTFSLLLGSFVTVGFSATFGTLELFSSIGTRSFEPGSSTISIATAFNSASAASGLTIIPSTSTISMIGSNSTFNGAGRTYYNFQNSAGLGGSNCYLNGSNTFTNILRGPYGVVGGSKTTTIFEAGSTQTITGDFMTGDTLGINSQLAIISSVAGTRFNISKASGTNSVIRTYIQDSNATGGATWQAFTSNNNTDGGNNLGWDFGSQSNFLALMI